MTTWALEIMPRNVGPAIFVAFIQVGHGFTGE